MTSVVAQELKYDRPWMYPEQNDAFFCDERYGLTEASTKAGKTVGCIVWLTEQAFVGGGDGRNYWWVAPVYSQAQIAYTRTKRAIPRHLFSALDGQMKITLYNGAHIWFKSGDNPDNLFGEDVYAAVIDEASRVREESWHAVRSTITATRGPMRIIGNVKGRRNWFWRMARQAEAGDDPTMHYSRITAYNAIHAGVLSKDEVDDAQRKLPTAVFRELYEAEASDDEGNPFGFEFIKKCTKSLSPKPPVCFGWDLARKLDFTVGIGLDDSGDVCRFHRFQAPWHETTERILEESQRVPSLVDSSGVGDPILENLQRDGSGRYEGYLYSAQSKQKLMEGLAVAIHSGTIGFPEGPITGELESFEYRYTRLHVLYSAPEGMNDDCVNALALAWAKWNGRRRISRRERGPVFIGGTW